MADSTRDIAIVGAGFCGTVTAVNLLRQPHAEPLRIFLIDRDQHARGAAYAERPFPYLLNVPAGRMSALSSEPLDFLRFARKRIPTATAEDFLPRALYGEYLEELLLTAEHSAAPHVTLERVRGTVRSLDIWPPGHTFMLSLGSGRELRATEVILAFGNPTPAELPGAEAMRASGRLIENPWVAKEALEQDESVLVVGTGLTMADIVAATLQPRRGPARVHAISRHGLVPPRQTAFRHSHSEFDPLPLLRAAAFSVRRMFRLVRSMCREAQGRGGDWREAIHVRAGPDPQDLVEVASCGAQEISAPCPGLLGYPPPSSAAERPCSDRPAAGFGTACRARRSDPAD